MEIKKEMSLTLLCFLLVSMAGCSLSSSCCMPPLIQGEAAALIIGRAMLVSRFGAEQIQLEEPLKARITESGNWIVNGTLPPRLIGGVAQVEISPADGRVIKLVHWQ